MLRARRIPRGDKRRDEIAAVAEQVFLELGFSKTTMQMVASRAGASKETLYRHFDSKEGLFSEVICGRSAHAYEQLKREIGRRNDPREVLNRFGFNLLHTFINNDSLSLLRILLSQVQSTPELGRTLLERVPDRFSKDLASYLGYATQLGFLNCKEPLPAAKLLLAAMVADRHIIKPVVIKLGVPSYEEPSDEVIRNHVEQAVTTFLAAYGSKAERGDHRQISFEHGHA